MSLGSRCFRAFFRNGAEAGLMSKSESSISRREADDRLIDDRQASELCSSGTEQASRKTPKDLRQPIRLLLDCPYAIGRVAMKARGPTIKSVASTSSPFRALVREITRDIPAKNSSLAEQVSRIMSPSRLLKLRTEVAKFYWWQNLRMRVWSP